NTPRSAVTPKTDVRMRSDYALPGPLGRTMDWLVTRHAVARRNQDYLLRLKRLGGHGPPDRHRGFRTKSRRYGAGKIFASAPCRHNRGDQGNFLEPARAARRMAAFDLRRTLYCHRRGNIIFRSFLAPAIRYCHKRHRVRPAGPGNSFALCCDGGHGDSWSTRGPGFWRLRFAHHLGFLGAILARYRLGIGDDLGDDSSDSIAGRIFFW